MALPALHRVPCVCLYVLRVRVCDATWRGVLAQSGQHVVWSACARRRTTAHTTAFVDMLTRAYEQVNKTFDTWGSITEANALAAQLSRFTPEHTVVVTSFDAWERCFNHAAAQELTRCGIDGAFCFCCGGMT